jgi:hypothetical protein
MPEGISKCISDRDRVPKRLPDSMRERMSKYKSDRMPDRMSSNMSSIMPDGKFCYCKVKCQIEFQIK